MMTDGSAAWASPADAVRDVLTDLFSPEQVLAYAYLAERHGERADEPGGPILWVAYEEEGADGPERILTCFALDEDAATGRWECREVSEWTGPPAASCPLEFFALVPEATHPRWRESVAEHHARASCTLALELSEAGQAEAALEAIERASAFLPREGGFHLLRGRFLARRGRHEEAREAFGRAVELDHYLALAWGLRGWTLYALGEWEEALESFDRAAELEPESAEWWCGRAHALWRLTREAEALASFARAAEAEPENGRPHWGEGLRLRELGRHEEALACFERALALDPNLADAREGRAESLRALGRSEAVAAGQP